MNKIKEIVIQKKLELQTGGGHESCLTGIPDIVTSTEVIEIKRWLKFKEAFGQIILYSRQYPNKEKRLHFFDEPITNLSLLREIYECARDMGIVVTSESDNDEEFKKIKEKVESGVVLPIHRRKSNKETAMRVQKICLVKEVFLTELRLAKIPTDEQIHVQTFEQQLCCAQLELDPSLQNEFFSKLDKQDANLFLTRLTLIRELCSLIGIPNTTVRNFDIPCMNFRQKRDEISALFLRFNSVFHIKCKLLNSYSSLRGSIQSMLTLWSGSKLKIRTHSERKIPCHIYKAELFIKHETHKLEELPSFELDLIRNKQDNEIIRGRRYVYTLEPPTTYFDSHLKILFS